MNDVAPDSDPMLTVTAAGIEIDRLARLKGGPGSALHHALLTYQAFSLLESLGSGTAAQLRLSSRRTGDGRRFWYEGTQVSSTVTLLTVARAMIFRDDGLRPAYVEAVRRPPTPRLFTSNDELHDAKVEVMTGPYTVVTLIESPEMGIEEAIRVARGRAMRSVDAGLAETPPPGPDRDLS